MTTGTNTQCILTSRPVEHIEDGNFAWRESAVPATRENQIVCRNLYLSLDPAMRGWMSDAASYVEPVPLGSVMRGACIAEVIESTHPDYAVGDTVFGLLGWQEYALAGPEELPTKLPAGLPLPVTAFLSVLGISGLTAYFGLHEIGKPKAGETVVVSSAAGAVGSIAGQLAMKENCRVVGIAGTDEKCAWLTDELGFDAAINYKTQDVGAALRKACPEGIDIYWDNVGGETLDAALALIAMHARVVICGAMTRFNTTGPMRGPSDYYQLLIKRARMEGFVLLDFQERFMEGVMALAQLAMSGDLKFREEVIDGLHSAPAAIHKLYDGTNTGKLIIKIADPTPQGS